MVLAAITVIGALVGVATFFMIWLMEELVRFVVFWFTKKPGIPWDNKPANDEVRLMKSFANWSSAFLVVLVVSVSVIGPSNYSNAGPSQQAFLSLGLLPLVSGFGLLLGFSIYAFSCAIRGAMAMGRRPEVVDGASKIKEASKTSLEKASKTFKSIKDHEYRQ